MSVSHVKLFNSHCSTLPRAVFFRNLFCDTGRSCRCRLRIVIGGCAGVSSAVVAIVAVCMETEVVMKQEEMLLSRTFMSLNTS
jgi:hypothetical protein